MKILISVFICYTLVRNSLSQVETDMNYSTTVFTEKIFFLKSPNYPEIHRSEADYLYVLKNPGNCPTLYKFSFLYFDIKNCDDGKLLIQNQTALCGQNLNDTAYFSDNGTLYVRFISGKGESSKKFNIFVSRNDCEVEVETTTDLTVETSTDQTESTTMQFQPSESTTMSYQPFNLQVKPLNEEPLPNCCVNVYNTKAFIITSPNFPQSLNQKENCVIHIQKASENICRIRLAFAFFYLGPTSSNNCSFGHLEIDGKYICNCNANLKLTTTFDKNNYKQLIFKSNGVNLGSKNGFVIQGIQDECPTKYYPVKSNYKNLDNLIEKAELLHQNQLIHYPKTIKSFYYFSIPDNNALPREIEPSTFIDTSTINSIVTSSGYGCEYWNRRQHYSLKNNFGTSLDTCKRTQNNERKCFELDYPSGYFKSPGYPFFYGNNLSVCYRFRKQTGYCAIKIFMVDFRVQYSYGCWKDYVLLENGDKYCGTTLFRRSFTFDLTHKDYYDILFVSDKCHYSRGFYGLYSQIPCHNQPTHPTEVPDFRTTSTSITTTTINPKPAPVCDRFINEDHFLIQVNGDVDKCIFQIRKSSRDVCKIYLYFERFELYCGSEKLLVNKMGLCGYLTGNKISVNYEENMDIIDLIYESSLGNKSDDVKLNIRGEQITDDCLYPLPPAQRIIYKL